jgi:trehalose 6-phosphate synthase/phosphatase
MKLLIVSNRLPVTLIKEGPSFNFQESVGGLASGLKSYLTTPRMPNTIASQYGYLWVGWPGLTVEEGKRDALESRLLSEHRAHPVFLSERSMDQFYHGFSNKTLWPLFHYFPSLTQFDEDSWINYVEVNRAFCESVMEIVRPKDIVWIHDYHLMLLPRMLRDASPDLRLGFFLHIPFPSFEIFRLLPSKWRRQILEGLLGADLIGFHTYDYTQHFLQCVHRILGYDHDMGQVMAEDHLVKVGTFPMGIDYHEFNNAPIRPEVVKEKAELKNALGDCQVILSIDRLDYSKGIINRLKGYELFLKRRPEWQGKVIMVLVVVPSRTKVEHYQQMKRQIDEFVGRINGRCGKMNWMPILYHYKYLPFSQLIALYSLSDVALVTPLRDGMNLIAKEYLAAKRDGRGVLILSEMAGASKEMGETLIINPNDMEEIAWALETALEMPEKEQVRCNRAIQSRLKRYNVCTWAEEFLKALLSFKDEQGRWEAKLLSPAMKEEMINEFRDSHRRLLLLDYDGTLVPLTKHPMLARPSPVLLKMLNDLSQDERTKVVLISGRNKAELEGWFSGLKVGLVAEHGVWVRDLGGRWEMLKPLKSDWKPKVLPLLERYSVRLPGSFVEEKEFSLAWHYRMSDPDMASTLAKELIDGLVNFTANIDLQVVRGNKVVEVRNAGVDKGNAGLYLLKRCEPDFILAIGDDWTDEDLFKVLPERAHSIRVGLGRSYARHSLHRHEEVIQLLQELAS